MCVGLLFRLVLPRHYRRLLDRGLHTIKTWVLYVPRLWRASRLAARTVANAQGRDGEWRGNVFAPKSFRKPRKPRKPH
jgi:hypothetical protein